MKYAFLVLALLACESSVQADPFADLRTAYAARDANAAAAAYAKDAEVIYRYEGAPEERHKGEQAIAASFAALFNQIDPKDQIDLNFREMNRVGNRVQGIYRLKLGRALMSYGHFEVLLDASGKFASDISTSATQVDFEEALGPIMLDAADETLDRSYYAQLTGRYRLPDGCTLIVTRSMVRLFVRNSCTNEWRGLSRKSGRVWSAGDTVISDKTSSAFSFAPLADGKSPSLAIVDVNGARIAQRYTAYRTENVSFTSFDGTSLAGTLYLPLTEGKRNPATVMLHGSGPQDRDGYASIIAVMADQLAASGRVVLAFDKRGTEGSEGDGDRAGFDILGTDARAAMEFLAKRPEVDAKRIGFAGSSQAGWVAAKAIADGATPADVFLLGAAGTALTVAEQNLYNTEVQMRCQGIAANDIRLALDQQMAFFQFLKDPSKASKLDALTAQARTRPGLTDWLFPDSRTTDRGAGAWYVVLDPFFDPLQVWKRYRGKTKFLFSQFDDSTPTLIARARLKRVRAEVGYIANAQHLGLVTKGICQGGVADLSQFSPELISSISKFGMSGN